MNPLTAEDLKLSEQLKELKYPPLPRGDSLLSQSLHRKYQPPLSRHQSLEELPPTLQPKHALVNFLNIGTELKTLQENERQWAGSRVVGGKQLDFRKKRNVETKWESAAFNNGVF